MKRILPLALLLLSLSSCKKMFLYHPEEVRPDYHNLNAINLERLAALPEKTNFKFVLVGDNQRFYDQFDDFITLMNSRDDISFILLDGDMVDFGLNKEYNWVAERMQRLNKPYICALGNHDMLANGKLIFNEMFGPENFSFTWSGSKFIVINTNSREAGFDGTVPDINWLSNEVHNDGGATNLFVLSHVAPYSGDFDRNLEQPYAQALESNPHTRISLHGHEHRYELTSPYEDEIPYLLAGSAGDRTFCEITVTGDQYQIEHITY